MQLSDFYFDLPKDLIANIPLPNRRDSRLLYLNQEKINHKRFPDVLHLTQPGDLLVFNNTKVMPARLFGRKQSGGKVELLVERILNDQQLLAQLHVSKSPKVGEIIIMAEKFHFKVQGRQERFYCLQLQEDEKIFDILSQFGEVPLPPYMERSPNHHDTERFQTVYAAVTGSVAAPTAGLHFDQPLIAALKAKGVQIGMLTLHIGAGTFLPVRENDIRKHKMHAEMVHVSSELCQQIKATKAAGKRIIAVGTTSLRALETSAVHATQNGFSGETNLFIYPGYQFQWTDALITNFHLPGSSLLMLVCAFGGYKNMMQAYQIAIAEQYRFYSYGDAMWINKIAETVCR